MCCCAIVDLSTRAGEARGAADGAERSGVRRRSRASLGGASSVAELGYFLAEGLQ